MFIVNLDSILKSGDITLPTKAHLFKDMVLPVVMYELDYKEGWAPKNWCFWAVVLEKILESPLDCKEIQPVHPKGNQSWIFIGRTDPEAETSILWPPGVKNWLIWKDPDAGRQIEGRRRGRQNEMAGSHHRLNGHEFEQTAGNSKTGKPGVLQSIRLQRVGHDWVTGLNWFIVPSCLMENAFLPVLFLLCKNKEGNKHLWKPEFSSWKIRSMSYRIFLRFCQLFRQLW